MRTKWQEKREKGRKKIEKGRGRKSLTQVWNVLKCEVIGKKTKEGNKEKKIKGIVCGGSGREKEERMRQRKKK